jgi:predicted nucleic acid-binding protein
LAPEALDLAIRFDRSVYDCLYLALAVRTKSVMVTADHRLANALAGGPLGKHVAWIGGVM